MSSVTLSPRSDGLALVSPYDPAFVAAFKALLTSRERTWDAHNKVWVIDPSKADAVADLCHTFFGARPSVPALAPVATGPEIRTITLEYLGQCKLRDLGAEPTAMGYAGGAWSVVAPESVLRAWFDPFGAQADAPASPDAPQTLYGLLGVGQDADEGAIKAGYRRMARQWHPDACREPDAKEMFIRIKAAYDVLSDPLKRRKYNAGLLFEAQKGREIRRRPDLSLMQSTVYRAPLRCGLLVVECLPRLGRLTLTKILSWQDIVDGAGRVMVASWDVDRERIRVEWVQP